MRLLTCALMAIHGLIHVLGFMAAFRLADLPLRAVAPPGTPALGVYYRWRIIELDYDAPGSTPPQPEAAPAAGAEDSAVAS